MFFKRYGNLVIGIFFAAAALVYYGLAAALPKSEIMKVGPDFMPKLVAVLTFIIASVLIVLSVQTLRKTPKPPAEPSSSDWARVAATAVVFTIYALVFESVGFPLATVVYLAAQIVILMPREHRSLPLAAGVSLVTTAAVFFIFRDGLSVMLPTGVLRDIL